MATVSAPRARWSARRSTLASIRLAVLTFLADPQWLIPSMIAPIVFGFVSYELFIGTPDLVVYVILGAGMMSMWGQTLYGSGWATGQDRNIGTLEPTLSAPTPYLFVVLGRILWNVVSGLVGIALVFVVIVAATGTVPSIDNPLAFAVLFLFTMFTLAAVGTVFAAAYVYTRYAGFIQNVGEFAFYIGTGCMFPVIILPFWTNPIALFFPPSWALDALRYASIPGYVGFSWGLGWDIVGGVATTAIYLVTAGLVFKRVERHVLEAGNLQEY